MTKKFVVSVAWLRSQFACAEQVNLFERKFGQRVTVTEEVIRKHGLLFDAEWFGNRVLCDEDCSMLYNLTMDVSLPFDQKINELRGRIYYRKDGTPRAHALSGKARDEVCSNIRRIANARKRAIKAAAWGLILNAKRRQSHRAAPLR